MLCQTQLMHCFIVQALFHLNQFKEWIFLISGKILELMLRALLISSKKFLPNLKKDDGASVVFISSVAAKSGMTFHSSIAASKAALEGFARSLASELAPRVAVNCVAPSLTNTPMAEHLLNNEKKLQSSEERHPLNAIGDPAKVAKVIYNLFSAKEDWITGQTISIDGGLSSLR